MRLLVTCPTRIVADLRDVAVLRAEDETGSFGILAGHADFLTVLTVSVMSWRRQDGQEGFCAVRGGVLTVKDGREVLIATRQAVLADSLEALEPGVLMQLRAEQDAERTERAASLQLHMKAIREIVRRLQPGLAAGVELAS